MKSKSNTISLKYVFSILKSYLQLFAICYSICEFFCFLNFIYIGFLIWLLFTPFYYLTIIYFIWFIYDKDSYKKGGHLYSWCRHWVVWRYAAEYFSLELHKTADLDPNKNYIIGYHPHGITGLPAFFHFCTEATDFSKKFPGITSRIVVINAPFYLPIHREILLFCGGCGNGKESLEWIVNRNGTGNAGAIIVGGALESLNAVPNTLHLNLKNRKGFVKIALKYGTSLVPCISFGDNEVYTSIKAKENSMIRKLQLRLLKSLTFALPLFYGRGFTENTIGIIPYRKKITSIMGKPIDVPKVENPTQDDIDKLHEVYVKSLCDLFYEHREQYSENPNIEIVIR